MEMLLRPQGWGVGECFSVLERCLADTRTDRRPILKGVPRLQDAPSWRVEVEESVARKVPLGGRQRTGDTKATSRKTKEEEKKGGF